MLTEPKGIGHLNEKGCRRDPSNMRRIRQENPRKWNICIHEDTTKTTLSLMYWVIDQHRFRETTDIFNYVDELTLYTIIKEADKR